MLQASAERVTMHTVMLAESNCLWTVDVEPNFRTYESCPKPEGDARLSYDNSRVVRLILMLFDVDWHREVPHCQIPCVVPIDVYLSNWHPRNEIWQFETTRRTADGILTISSIDIVWCISCCWDSIEGYGCVCLSVHPHTHTLTLTLTPSPWLMRREKWVDHAEVQDNNERLLTERSSKDRRWPDESTSTSVEKNRHETCKVFNGIKPRLSTKGRISREASWWGRHRSPPTRSVQWPRRTNKAEWKTSSWLALPEIEPSVSIGGDVCSHCELRYAMVQLQEVKQSVVPAIAVTPQVSSPFSSWRRRISCWILTCWRTRQKSISPGRVSSFSRPFYWSTIFWMQRSTWSFLSLTTNRSSLT